MFSAGFGKTASATGPANAGMVQAVGEAFTKSVQNTAPVQNATSAVNRFLRKAQSLNIFGNPNTQAPAKMTGSSAAKSGPSANLSLKDGNRLELNYGRFKGTAAPDRFSAQYNVSDKLKLEASKSGGEGRFMAGYKKDF